MKKTRTHCPNCDSQYEYRARECGQCGRKRDQIDLDDKKINHGNDLESQKTQISSGVRIRSSQKTNLHRVAAPIELSNSVHPATQTSGVPVSVKPGVTYRTRLSKSTEKRTTFSGYLIGAIGLICLLLYMIVLLRNIYDVTKPTSKVNLTTPTMPIASNTQQSEGNVDPEHIRYMRAKKAKDMKEAAAYTQVLAEKAAEAKRLEEERLEYERSQRIIQAQWQQYQRSQQLYQVVGSGGVNVGPRGGRFTYTASGKKRYLSSGKSSSGSSRKRGRRR
jgi:hypothetical protein